MDQGALYEYNYIYITKKAEWSFLYATLRSDLFYILPKFIKIFLMVQELWPEIKMKGNYVSGETVRKQDEQSCCSWMSRVVVLVCDTPPDLFYSPTKYH